jgi:hypothetical protein
MGSGQFFGQMHNERDWEKARRPYYNMWPSIIPMLTRLNLDIDSDLIQLPLPARCIRFPKDAAKNPLKFDCRRRGPIRRAFLAGSRGRRGPRGRGGRRTAKSFVERNSFRCLAFFSCTETE